MRELSNLSPAEVKRAWRIVSWAGLLGSTYYLLCVNGAPRIKFLTELHATNSDFGLIAGLGSFLLIFQILGSILSNRLTRRKPLWMFITIAHRLSFAGVVLAPLLFDSARERIWWIILVLCVHDTLTQTGTPIWLSWMADLIPQESTNLRWAVRQKFITAVSMFVVVAVALGFDFFEKAHKVIPGFTVLATIGIALGVTDILLFLGVPESPNRRIPDDHLLKVVVQPLKDFKFRPFLTFIGFWNFGIFLSAPFMSLFLIQNVGMSVMTVQLLSIPGSIGVVISSRFWALVCDTYGYRRTLQILTIGKAFAPLYFILTPRIPEIGIPFLWLMYFIDGIMNSGVALAQQGVLLKATPQRNRAMYIAASNFFAVGIMAGIAPVIAGRAIDSLNRVFTFDMGSYYHINGYHIIFAVSMLLRFAAYPLASRIHDESHRSLRMVVRELTSLETYRVLGLLRRLRKTPDELHRILIISQLGRIGNPMAIGDLIDLLHDENRSVREAAANTLGIIGVEEAARPLGRALREPDLGIQTPAARALGRIGGDDSLRALLFGLNELREQNSEALGETIDGLGRIGDSAAIVPLICLFHEYRDEALQRRIASALGKLGDTDSVDEVLSVLQDR